MRPKKRVDVTQLPALAKRIRMIVGKNKPISETMVTDSHLIRFGKQFISSFFAKEPWLGRYFIKFLGRKAKYYWCLERMQRHFIRAGMAKNIAEANSLIEKKLNQIIDDVHKLEKRLRYQRTIDPKMIDQIAYHKFLPCMNYILDFADNLSFSMRLKAFKRVAFKRRLPKSKKR